MIVDRGYPFWFGGFARLEWGQVHYAMRLLPCLGGAPTPSMLRIVGARKILGSYSNHMMDEMVWRLRLVFIHCFVTLATGLGDELSIQTSIRITMV